MIARRAVRLAAVTALAASSIGVGVATASAATSATSATHVRPASTFLCSASGNGSSLQGAEHDAETSLKEDYTVLSGFTLQYSTENPDGSWYVVMTAHCGNPR